MSTFEYIHYKVVGNTAEINLDRPPVNALNLDMLEDLLSALRRAGDDAQVRAIILSSALPKRFCAGLDLDILRDPSGTPARSFVEKLYVELWEVQSQLGKPTIAAVNGAARGGGMTLAISCDVILASDEASFGYPEIDLGLVPAIHFAHLPRIIGRHRAFELLFSGRTFHAAEAAQLGLISRVHSADTLLVEASALAQVFAEKPPATMQLGKAMFNRASDSDYGKRIENAVEDFSSVAASAEAQEGIAAFVEKRRPGWIDGG